MSKPELIILVVVWLTRLWKCKILKWHEWTCAAVEGIPATAEQRQTGIKGFYSYARMYCKRCGVESEVSRLHRENMNHE